MSLLFLTRYFRLYQYLLLFFFFISFIQPAYAESADYWIQTGKSFGDNGKWNESLDASEKAIAIEPNDEIAWNNKAWALVHLKRYQESLDAAEKALSIKPNYINAWGNQVDALIGLQRYGDALIVSEKIISFYPNNAKGWNTQANVLGNLKRWNESLDASEKAITINSDYTEAWITKSWALGHLDKDQEALTAVEKAISLNPNNAIAWNNKAWILTNLNRNEEAIIAADKSISIDPDYASPWYNKGYALRELGRYDDALAALNKSLSIDPDFDSPKNLIISIMSVNYTNNTVMSQSVTTSATNPQPPVVVLPGIQVNQPLFLPLIFLFLLIVIGLAAFGYKNYKQQSTKPVSLSPVNPPINSSKKSHHDVFISYAQNDKPIADATCAKLESFNIRCWISPRDVPPGENFPKAIIEGIEGSKIMVLIFSSHSNNSQHVIREITSAVNKGLIIIPFRIENILPSKDMEYLISTPHWLDAITPPLEEHLNTLATRINKILLTYMPEFGEKMV
jgi:tetratricopeptide (TPR) repeat protein